MLVPMLIEFWYTLEVVWLQLIRCFDKTIIEIYLNSLL